MSVHVSSAYVCVRVCVLAAQSAATSRCSVFTPVWWFRFGSEQIAANADTEQKQQHASIPLHLHAHPAVHARTRTHTHVFGCSSLLLFYLFLFSLVHTPPLLPFSSFTPRHLVSPGPLSPFFPSPPLPVSTPLSDARALAADRSTLGDRRGRSPMSCQSSSFGQWVQRVSSQSCFAENYRRQEEGNNSRQGHGEALYFPLLCVRVCGRDRVSELEHSQYSRGDILNPSASTDTDLSSHKTLQLVDAFFLH